jgi:integrase
MLSALREGPDGDLMAALFVFAVETGMRLSEILSVYPAQVLKTDEVRTSHSRTPRTACLVSSS